MWGKGAAVVRPGLAFRYALSIEAAHPTSGSVRGGTEVEVLARGLNPRVLAENRAFFGADEHSIVPCDVREVGTGLGPAAGWSLLPDAPELPSELLSMHAAEAEAQGLAWLRCVTGPPFDPIDYDPQYGEVFDSPWLFDNDDTNVPGADLDHDTVPLQLTVTWTYKEYTTVCGDTDCALPPCSSGFNCTFRFRDTHTPSLAALQVQSRDVQEGGLDPGRVAAAGVAADGDVLRLTMPGLAHFLSLSANRTAANGTEADRLRSNLTLAAPSLLQVFVTQTAEQVAGAGSAAWRQAIRERDARRAAAASGYNAVDYTFTPYDASSDEGEDHPLECDPFWVSVEDGVLLCRVRGAALAPVGEHSLRVRVRGVGDSESQSFRTGPRVDRVSMPGVEISSQGGGAVVVIEGRGLIWGNSAAAARALLEWERAEPVRDGLSTPAASGGVLPPFPISGSGGSSFALPDVVLPLAGTRCRLTAVIPPSPERVACVMEALPAGGPTASFDSGVLVSMAGVVAGCAAAPPDTGDDDDAPPVIVGGDAASAICGLARYDDGTLNGYTPLVTSLATTGGSAGQVMAIEGEGFAGASVTGDDYYDDEPVVRTLLGTGSFPQYLPNGQLERPPALLPDSSMDIEGATVPVVMLGPVPARVVAFNDTLIRYEVPRELPAGYVTLVVRTTRGVAVWEGRDHNRRTGVVSGHVHIRTALFGVEVPAGPWEEGLPNPEDRVIDTRYIDRRSAIDNGSTPYWTVPLQRRTISPRGGAVVAVHGAGFGPAMPPAGLEMMVVDPDARAAALRSASSMRGLQPEAGALDSQECAGGEAFSSLGPSLVSPSMAKAIGDTPGLGTNRSHEAAWDIVAPGIATAVGGDLPGGAGPAAACGLPFWSRMLLRGYSLSAQVYNCYRSIPLFSNGTYAEILTGHCDSSRRWGQVHLVTHAPSTAARLADPRRRAGAGAGSWAAYGRTTNHREVYIGSETEADWLGSGGTNRPLIEGVWGLDDVVELGREQEDALRPNVSDWTLDDVPGQSNNHTGMPPHPLPATVASSLLAGHGVGEVGMEQDVLEDLAQAMRNGTVPPVLVLRSAGSDGAAGFRGTLVP